MFFKHSFSFLFLLAFASMNLSASQKPAEKKNEDSLKVYQVPSITVTTTKAIMGQSPVPFSEVTKSEIQSSYTYQDMPMLLADLPSVIFSSQNGNGIGYSDMTMRGFDQRRISVLINGIPQNDPEDHNVYWIDFPDLSSNLDNVQVQRGAGLLNYGAAAIGGSINLTTSNFVERQGVTIFNGIGYQEYGAGGSDKFQPTIAKNSIEVSSGLVNNQYAFYGRLSRINSNGYRDQSFANLNSYFLSAVRFDKNLTTQINVFGGPINDGLAYLGLPKSYIEDPELRRKNFNYWLYDSTGKNVAYGITRRAQEHEEYSQPHYELLNDWYINDNLTFKSAIFYYSGEGLFDYDGSWVDTTGYRLTGVNGWHPTQNPGQSMIRASVNNSQGGWIPRLIWNHGTGELMAGAEIRIHRSDHFGKIAYAENLPANYDPDYKFYSNNGKRDIFSLFARERYFATDNLTLSAEAQVVRQRYSISDEKAGNQFTQYKSINGDIVGNGGELFNVNYIFFNPRLGANYKINDEMDVYFMSAFTSREPRMRNLYAADDAFWDPTATPLFETTILPDSSVAYDFSKPLIKPERMLDFELGWNFSSPEFFASVNAYWMEYYDELIKSGRVNIYGDPIDGNADRTRHLGLELQAGLNLLKWGDGNRLELAGNATLSHNRIIKLNFITNNKDVVDLAGNQIAGFPDMIGNLRLDVFAGNLFASISGKYIGEFRSDNFGDMITENPLIVAHLRKPDAYGDYSSYYTDNVVESSFHLNANLAYTFKNIFSLQSVKIQAQVNNILNELYAGGAEGMYFFPGAERNVFVGLEIGL